MEPAHEIHERRDAALVHAARDFVQEEQSRLGGEGARELEALALARGEDPELFVVQARPVTAVAKKQGKAKAESAMSLIMSTFGARPPKGD